MWLNWPLFFPFLLWYISDFSSLSSWYPFSISLAVPFIYSTIIYWVPSQSWSLSQGLCSGVTFSLYVLVYSQIQQRSFIWVPKPYICLFCIFTWISNCCLWLYILQIETPPTSFLLFISEWHHCTQNMQAKVPRVILISCLSPFCQSPSPIDLACLIPQQSIHPLPSFSLVTSLSPHHHLSVLL